MKNEAIKMMKLPLSVVRVAALCLPLALVASCGSGSEAVQGTKINISPISVGVTSSTTVALTVVYFTQAYQVELRSPSGYPLVNTKVTLVSRGTMYNGFPVILDANVVCTGSAVLPAECTDPTLASALLPNSYEATTDSTGTVRVTMIFAFFSGSKGTVTDLEAFSGTGYGKTDVVLACVEGAGGPCPS
jgi:hypothetical protein